MKNLSFSSFLLFITLLLSCRAATDLLGEKERLLETDREFARTSMLVGTAEAFRQYLDEDALLLPDGGMPVRGVEMIYRRMSTAPQDLVLDWQPEEGLVSACGGLGKV